MINRECRQFTERFITEFVAHHTHTHPLCARDMSRLRELLVGTFFCSRARQTNTDGKHDDNFSSSLSRHSFLYFVSVSFLFIIYLLRNARQRDIFQFLCKMIERCEAYAWINAASHIAHGWIISHGFEFRFVISTAARSPAAQLTMK